MLEWHPRDVDSLLQHYQDEASASRLEAQREAHKARMSAGR